MFETVKVQPDKDGKYIVKLYGVYFELIKEEPNKKAKENKEKDEQNKGEY